MNGGKKICFGIGDQLIPTLHTPQCFPCTPKTHKQHTTLVFRPLKGTDLEPPLGNTQTHIKKAKSDTVQRLPLSTVAWVQRAECEQEV